MCACNEAGSAILDPQAGSMCGCLLVPWPSLFTAKWQNSTGHQGPEGMISTANPSMPQGYSMPTGAFELLPKQPSGLSAQQTDSVDRQRTAILKSHYFKGKASRKAPCQPLQSRPTHLLAEEAVPHKHAVKGARIVLHTPRHVCL